MVNCTFLKKNNCSSFEMGSSFEPGSSEIFKVLLWGTSWNPIGKVEVQTHFGLFLNLLAKDETRSAWMCSSDLGEQGSVHDT